MMGAKLLVKDCIWGVLLMVFCIMAGLIVNEMRAAPLTLIYVNPEVRLNQIVRELGSSSTPANSDIEISSDEVRMFSIDHSGLILDARPEIFYRVGHIPSALSLPRDDFGKRYLALQPKFNSHTDTPLIVYCSGGACYDSLLVAHALEKLGYSRVKVFRGGWDAWQASGFSVEIGDVARDN